MKTAIKMPAALFAVIAISSQLGCGGTSADPKTIDMSDLNSPGVVETVTGAKTIQVRFNTGNFEKEFKGYYVFATTKALADLKDLVKYPSGADITKSGIPRCADNSAFFEAFGLAAATNDCKGATNVGDPTATFAETREGTFAPSVFKSLADDDKMSNYQACSEAAADAAISLPIGVGGDGKIASKGTQKCTISKAYDSTAKTSGAMANGTSYGVMAMTVAGDKYNKVSWSSSIVTDTPAPQAYSGNVTLSASKYRLFTINADFDTATLSSSESDCPATDLCKVTGTNTQSTDAIYISRDNAGAYPQRIFISTPSDSSIRLLARGPQTYDPLDPAVISARTPADTAIAHGASSQYAAAGVVLTAYEDKVFDFVMTTSGSTYRYGKIVFGNITYATTTSETSQATIPITIITQPKAGSTDYFAP